MTQKTMVSVNEFLRLAQTLGPCELIDGEVIELSPGGGRHSHVTMKIGLIIGGYVLAKKMGRLLGNEVGLVVKREPPRVRGADLAFLSYLRLPKGPVPSEFLTVPPELVIEVFGDDISWPKMQEKVADYHAFGVDVVWVADPQTRTVKVFPKGAQPFVIHDGDEIDGGGILPGFRVPIADFFDEN